MGRFDAILLVSDLDGTILNDEKHISMADRRALGAFEAEGGRFSYVTGRAPVGLASVFSEYRPSTPVGCLNGGGIYDGVTGKWLARSPLSRDVMELVYEVERFDPQMGIELVSFDGYYFCKKNKTTEEHRSEERLPDLSCAYDEVPGDLAKLLFVDTPERLNRLIEHLSHSEWAERYEMIRSTDRFYEVMPRGINKGSVLLSLADRLGIARERTVAVGDNDNDVAMLRAAGLGVAVANASPAAREAADLVLDVTNNEDAIAALIEGLGNGRYPF